MDEEHDKHRKKLTEQRAIGVCLLLFCIITLWLSFTGTTPVDKDCTAVILLFPLSLYLLFTKKLVIL